MKIAFVILNYNTYNETVDCILSIENKIDTDDYKIVIIDNCSTDDSASKLSDFIKTREKAEIIRNTENLGFARGNNVGIGYVNKNYKPEFVAVINSDTELIQGNLTAMLDKEYQKSNFALLGPLVLTRDGKCDTSPMEIPNAENVKRDLAGYKKEERELKRGSYFFYRVRHYLKNKINRKSQKSPKFCCDFHTYQTDVVINGCFMIFSEKAFDFIDGFDERTFLYYEEAILYCNLMKKGLTTVYDPRIVIYHKMGCATNSFIKRKKDEVLFRIKYAKESADVLLSVLENE